MGLALVSDARVTVPAAYVALFDLSVDFPKVVAESDQPHDVGDLHDARAVVELEHSDVLFAAVHTRMRTQIAPDVILRQLASKPGPLHDDANVLLAVLGEIATRICPVALAADVLKTIGARLFLLNEVSGKSPLQSVHCFMARIYIRPLTLVPPVRLELTTNGLTWLHWVSPATAGERLAVLDYLTTFGRAGQVRRV
ncbi:hypothetical protein [Gryllotalpicola kribbensis]|uniref:hypothetical protein n=1 Tax=Gryllotalpicola kribbensis TaxID=993084 RepID=UPI0031DA25B8